MAESYTGPDNVNFVKLEFGKEYEIGNLKVTPLRREPQDGFRRTRRTT
ncbi:MAG: hypothetical protein ACLR5G_05315 [Eubacteriales bacterium]